MKRKPEAPNLIPPRHPLLAGQAHLDAAELAEWLEKTAVDKFTDIQKRIFTPEEIADFEHESSMQGREINRMEDVVNAVKQHFTKGSEEPATFTLPVTVGQKMLVTFRRQNDDLIEAGFEENHVPIFGIVNHEGETMEFFTGEGVHVPDRTRPLTAKEKHIHLGMFKKRDGDNIVDTETGEVEDLGKTA